MIMTKQLSTWRWFLIVPVFVACTTANAFQEAYIGANVGATHIGGEAQDIDDTTFNYSVDEVGFKVVTGYRASDYLAFEAGYLNFGRFSDTVGSTDVDLNPYALGLWAVGTLPLFERFELFARAGWGFWEAAIKTREGNVSEADRRDGSDFAYGIGAGVRLGEAFALRLEYDALAIENTDGASLISLGAYFLIR